MNTRVNYISGGCTEAQRGHVVSLGSHGESAAACLCTLGSTDMTCPGLGAHRGVRDRV